MRQINCYIPISVCITGKLSDRQLEELGNTLTAALASRLEFAEGAMASHGHVGLRSGKAEIIRAGYDPTREDAGGGYGLPSYDGPGDSRSVSVRRRGPSWFIRRAVEFQVRVGDFLGRLQSLSESLGREPLEDIELYVDLSDEIKWMSLWLVQVNQELLMDELEGLLYRRMYQLSKVSQAQRLYYLMDDKEETRQLLIEIDQDHVVEREVPSLALPTRLFGGKGERLRAGARLLFAGMVLPKIQLEGRADLGAEIELSIRLRDLTFLVTQDGAYDLFEHRFALSWQTYIQEFGDRWVTLRVQPVTIKNRTSYEVLQRLLEGAVLKRVQNELAPADAHLYGDVFLLNNMTLGKLPGTVRDRVTGITNDLTRTLDDTKRVGVYEPNWTAAYVYSVVNVSSKSVSIARSRPRAAADVDNLIPHIDHRLVTASEHWDFTDYVKNNLYGFFPPYFEVLLDELKRRDGGKWFNEFFERIKESEDYELPLTVIRSVKETNYANDPKVLDLVNYQNRKEHRRVTGDVYNAENQTVILDKLFGDQTVSVGDVFYDVWDSYKHEEQRIKPKSKFATEWAAALWQEGMDLVLRIAKGQDPIANGDGYTEEQFAEAVLKAVFSRVGITEDNAKDYFDTITIQLSVRLKGLKKYTDAYGLESVTVFYQVVEREKSGQWKDIGEVIEVGERDFDSMIDQWVHARVSSAIITFAHISLAFAAIGVAWEFGVLGTLVRIGGGAQVVIPSIIISTIFEVIIHGFTFESFLMGAINGFLGAVFFRGAGGLARGLFGRSITTLTFKTNFVKWLGVQAFKGTIGGGATGGGARFVEDVYNIATGQGGWSSAGAYAKSIGLGAAIGIGAEIAGPIILEPIANRVFGGARDLAKLLLKNKVSPARWRAWSAEVEAKIREKTTGLLEQQPDKASIIADGYKEVYDEIGEALEREAEAAKPRPKADKLEEAEEAGEAYEKVVAKPKGKKGTARGGDEEPVEGAKGEREAPPKAKPKAKRKAKSKAKPETEPEPAPDPVNPAAKEIAKYEAAQEAERVARNDLLKTEQDLKSLAETKETFPGRGELKEGLEDELVGAKQKLSIAKTNAAKAELELRASTLELHEKLSAAARNRKAFRDVIRLANGEDKIGNFKVDPKEDVVAGDHIVAIRRITTEAKFRRILDLSWEDQLEVVNLPRNLRAMKGKWNSSKSDTPWRDWPQGREYYGSTIADQMIVEETLIEDDLVNKINELWDAAQKLKPRK